MPAATFNGEAAFEKPLNFKYLGQPGQLVVSSAVGKPGAEFYVLFDAGPGHVVEIDQADIEAP